MGTVIPADICMPLLQLGYDSFADLFCRQRKLTLISTTDLCRVHGQRAKRGHKLALNRLTVVVNEQDLSKLTVETAKAYSSVAAIDIALRTVNNPMFTELCSQEHPGLRALRNQARSALRLLQIHVRNRASHARTTAAVKSLYPKPVLAWQNNSCATTAQSDRRYGQVGLVNHRTRVWVGPMRHITSVALAAEL